MTASFKKEPRKVVVVCLASMACYIGYTLLVQVRDAEPTEAYTMVIVVSTVILG